MSKIFLYLAVLALVGFGVSRYFAPPATQAAFIEGCLAAQGATRARCDCLADRLHEVFSVEQMRALMENRIANAELESRIKTEVARATQLCAG